MAKIKSFQKNIVTETGSRISEIDLDKVVFKESEKGEGNICLDPKAIIENAKKPDSRFNTPTDDVVVDIHYNENVFKQDINLTERLASKEDVDLLETSGKINPQTRAYSKHRTITFPVKADAVCDGTRLENEYSYLLTIANAPNAGNSKKGNGVSSSPLDMQLYFSGSNTDNYKMVMKEIYKTLFLAQRDSKAVVVTPIGLGVYLSGLEGRDIYYSESFDKNKIVNQKGAFTFVADTKTLYFTGEDGQYQEMKTTTLDKIIAFMTTNEAEKYGAVHLHMGTIKSFGEEFEQFVKGLPIRTDRPTVSDVNKTNYQALKEVIEELDQTESNTIQTIVLCTVRKEGDELMRTLDLKTIDVLQSQGDMLQTVLQIEKMKIPVGLLCAGSDHDIGGGTGDFLEKTPASLPGEEQTSLTSNFMKTLKNALQKGLVQYIPYAANICKQDFSKLPVKASSVSITKFSMLVNETQITPVDPDDIPFELTCSQ